MFACIGKNLRLPHFDADHLLNLPIFTHNYGMTLDNPYVNEFYWLEYKTPRLIHGTWMITRNANKFMPELVGALHDHMCEMMDFPFEKERINFSLSYGDVCSHRDDNGRKTALNIGLFNSNIAETRFSTEPRTQSTLDSFPSNYSSHVCQDGCAYLLDTANLHEVVASKLAGRIMATYSFTDVFENVIGLARNVCPL